MSPSHNVRLFFNLILSHSFFLSLALYNIIFSLRIFSFFNVKRFLSCCFSLRDLRITTHGIWCVMLIKEFLWTAMLCGVLQVHYKFFFLSFFLPLSVYHFFSFNFFFLLSFLNQYPRDGDLLVIWFKSSLLILGTGCVAVSMEIAEIIWHDINNLWKRDSKSCLHKRINYRCFEFSVTNCLTPGSQTYPLQFLSFCGLVCLAFIDVLCNGHSYVTSSI